MNTKSSIKNFIVNYLHKNKMFLCIFAVLIFLCIGVEVFVSNDYGFYSTPIARIVSIEESIDHIGYNGEKNKEIFYKQDITAVVLNGELKSKSIQCENIRSESNVYDIRYFEGDEVFVNQNQEQWQITNVKRDAFVCGVILLVFLLLILVGKSRGLLSLITVVISGSIFWFSLKFYKPGNNIFIIVVLLTILFILICLTIIGGFTKKTVIAIISTAFGVLVSFGLAAIVLLIFDYSGVYVESLEFLVVEIDYRRIFMAELLVGGLGSTMDIAMSISSALCELREKDANISQKLLIKSGKEIGKDITGTMTNVLLFTFLCGTIPLMMVVVTSGVPLFNYLVNNCTLEITRFLCGSIGIVLTVPISYVLSSLILGKAKSRGGTL